MSKDFKVKDISQANFGRKEISIAETEMPGLMALREEFKTYIHKTKEHYRAKIEPIKMERDKEISNIKNDYSEQRTILFEKFGYDKNNKPIKLKKKKTETPYKKKNFAPPSKDSKSKKQKPLSEKKKPFVPVETSKPKPKPKPKIDDQKDENKDDKK